MTQLNYFTTCTCHTTGGPASCSMHGGFKIPLSQVDWGSDNNINVHMCNCIGCCTICGECLTNPKHTADHCAKVAKWRSEYPSE